MDDFYDERVGEADVRSRARHGTRSNGIVVRYPGDCLHSPCSVRSRVTNVAVCLVTITWTDRIVRAWRHPASFPELVALRGNVLLPFSLGPEDNIGFECDANEVDDQVAELKEDKRQITESSSISAECTHTGGEEE